MIAPPGMCPVVFNTVDGYEFVETSDEWNRACRPLPCFAELYWPGYATAVRELDINGVPAIVQLWKGFCPRFLGGLSSFPGGYGAEVGIYRRVEKEDDTSDAPYVKAVLNHARNKLKPPKYATREVKSGRMVTSFPKPDQVLERPVRAIDVALSQLRHPVRPPRKEGEIWYPAPELHTKLSFKLFNPLFLGGDLFFETPAWFTGRPTRVGYWCNRWMLRKSYHGDYKKTHTIPMDPTRFTLKYQINGAEYVW
jgi:hypothetical protein